MAAMSKCISCLMEYPDTDTVLTNAAVSKSTGAVSKRCKPCNRLRQRISTEINKCQELKEFVDIGKETRASFNARHHDTFGRDLNLAMSETITEWRSSVVIRRFEGTGDYLDEVEVRKKYAGNPARCEAVLNSSKRFTCPTLKIQMYEDL